MIIYVWGIGGATARFIGKWLPIEEVSGFIISNKSGNVEEFMGKDVYTPDEITKITYDAILVCSVHVENIYRECLVYGIDLNKVIFMLRGGVAREDNFNYELAEKIFGEKYVNIIKNNWHVIDCVGNADIDDFDKYGYRHTGVYATDYVRYRTFELISNKINDKGIGGSIAELGVFRGDFTYYISREFPKRKLYLFDTFGGFDAEEAKKEKSEGNLTNVTISAYKNTNIQVVMEKVANPDDIKIMKGYFPKSLNGLEDTFAFVSIDVDLETSIYNGLDYFYPRLNEGGYIMVHDYNSYLRGVKKAVKRYEEDNGLSLCSVPLCDTAGTLVITK